MKPSAKVYSPFPRLLLGQTIAFVFLVIGDLVISSPIPNAFYFLVAGLMVVTALFVPAALVSAPLSSIYVIGSMFTVRKAWLAIIVQITLWLLLTPRFSYMLLSYEVFVRLAPLKVPAVFLLSASSLLLSATFLVYHYTHARGGQHARLLGSNFGERMPLRLFADLIASIIIGVVVAALLATAHPYKAHDVVDSSIIIIGACICIGFAAKAVFMFCFRYVMTAPHDVEPNWPFILVYGGQLFLLSCFGFEGLRKLDDAEAAWSYVLCSGVVAGFAFPSLVSILWGWRSPYSRIVGLALAVVCLFWAAGTDIFRYSLDRIGEKWLKAMFLPRNWDATPCLSNLLQEHRWVWIVLALLLILKGIFLRPSLLGRNGTEGQCAKVNKD